MYRLKHIKILVAVIILQFFLIVPNLYANPEYLQNPYLLKPTGQYGVGYKDLNVINTSLCPDKFYNKELTPEDYSKNNINHCHEMMVRVYYPSDNNNSIGNNYYKPVIMDFIKDISENVTLTEEGKHALNEMYHIKIYEHENAKPITKTSLPVIFFIGGAGVQAQNYTNIIDNLVSHGYVVIAMNSIYSAGSLFLLNGHVVEGYQQYQEPIRLEEYSDLTYIFPILKNLPYGNDLKTIMDFNKTGFLGHSMGAMNLIYYLQNNPKNTSIKAAIFMDPGNVLGDKNYPIHIKYYPTMTLWSSYFRHGMKGSMITKAIDKEIILTTNQNNVNFSNHINFTDYSTLQYSPSLKPKGIQEYLTTPNHVTLGNGNGFYLAQTINQYILQYFDGNLK